MTIIVIIVPIYRECMSEPLVEPAATITPVVGEYYCGLFTEDQCWYRSRVLSVNGERGTFLYLDHIQSFHIIVECKL